MGSRVKKQPNPAILPSYRAIGPRPGYRYRWYGPRPQKQQHRCKKCGELYDWYRSWHRFPNEHRKYLTHTDWCARCNVLAAYRRPQPHKKDWWKVGREITWSWSGGMWVTD